MPSEVGCRHCFSVRMYKLQSHPTLSVVCRGPAFTPRPSAMAKAIAGSKKSSTLGPSSRRPRQVSPSCISRSWRAGFPPPHHSLKCSTGSSSGRIQSLILSRIAGSAETWSVAHSPCSLLCPPVLFICVSFISRGSGTLDWPHQVLSHTQSFPFTQEIFCVGTWPQYLADLHLQHIIADYPRSVGEHPVPPQRKTHDEIRAVSLLVSEQCFITDLNGTIVPESYNRTLFDPSRVAGSLIPAPSRKHRKQAVGQAAKPPPKLSARQLANPRRSKLLHPSVPMPAFQPVPPPPPNPVGLFVQVNIPPNPLYHLHSSPPPPCIFAVVSNHHSDGRPLFRLYPNSRLLISMAQHQVTAGSKPGGSGAGGAGAGGPVSSLQQEFVTAVKQLFPMRHDVAATTHDLLIPPHWISEQHVTGVPADVANSVSYYGGRVIGDVVVRIVGWLPVAPGNQVSSLEELLSQRGSIHPIRPQPRTSPVPAAHHTELFRPPLGSSWHPCLRYRWRQAPQQAVGHGHVPGGNCAHRQPPRQCLHIGSYTPGPDRPCHAACIQAQQLTMPHSHHATRGGCRRSPPLAWPRCVCGCRRPSRPHRRASLRCI